MVKPRVGLLTLAQDYYLAEWYNKAPIEPMVERVLKALENAGLQVESYGTKYFLDEDEATKAALELAGRDVDAMIYLVATWILSNQVLNPYQATNLPFILWSIPEAIRSSTVGGAVVKGALDNMGVKEYKWVVGMPEDEATIKSILAFARAAATYRKMRNSRIGVVGYTTMQMYTADVDFTEIKKKFGISIEHFDADELIRETENIPDNEAEEVVDRIVKSFGRVEPTREFLLKASKQYLAFKRLAEKTNLQVIGAKCHPSPLIDYGMIPCLANTLINDEGELVFVCENDLNAALTMYVEHLITGQPTILADLGKVDREKNTIKLFNCGSAASWFAGGPEKTTLTYQYEWVGKGVASEYTFKPGIATVARLGKVKGEYVMHIARGEVIPTVKEVPRWPEGEVKLEKSVDEFLKHVISNHYHLVYGDYVEDLEDFCRITGVKPVVT